MVQFDRALATSGASGGVAAEKLVIAPQWVPISQIVLLTMKVCFLFSFLSFDFFPLAGIIYLCLDF